MRVEQLFSPWPVAAVLLTWCGLWGAASVRGGWGGEVGVGAAVDGLGTEGETALDLRAMRLRTGGLCVVQRPSEDFTAEGGVAVAAGASWLLMGSVFLTAGTGEGFWGGSGSVLPGDGHGEEEACSSSSCLRRRFSRMISSKVLTLTPFREAVLTYKTNPHSEYLIKACSRSVLIPFLSGRCHRRGHTSALEVVDATGFSLASGFFLVCVPPDGVEDSTALGTVNGNANGRSNARE